MDAIRIIETLKRRGFIIEPLGNNDIRLVTSDNNIPSHLIKFVRRHKNELLKGLEAIKAKLSSTKEEKPKVLNEKEISIKVEKYHQEQKEALGRRVFLLTNLIIRFLHDPECRKMVNYKGSPIINKYAVEKYLDQELKNFGYDLEGAIKVYQHYTPKQQVIYPNCQKCSYMPPFCNCGFID